MIFYSVENFAQNLVITQFSHHSSTHSVLNYQCVHLCCMVSRISIFHPDCQGSIPGEVNGFDLYPGIGCVSFVCILSCIVYDGGSNILLTIDSWRLALRSCLVSGP